MFDDLFAQPGLSLDRLRSFCCVAEAGGITKAAPGNPTRQSQFVRQINELEAFFGIELTRRQGRSVVLSSAGTRLARIVKETFVELDEFRRECKHEPMEFSIGGSDVILQWRLFPHIAQLHDAIPSAVFNVLSFENEDIAERVSDLRLDFGLVRKDAVSALHEWESLGTQTYSLFVPLRLLDVDKTPGWKEVITSIRLATVSGEEGLLAGLEREAAKVKIRPKVALVCSSFSQAAEALKSERFAAILPSFASADLDQKCFAAIPVPSLKSQAYELCLIWNPRIVKLRPRAGEVTKQLVKLVRLNLAQFP